MSAIIIPTMCTLHSFVSSDVTESVVLSREHVESYLWSHLVREREREREREGGMNLDEVLK